MTPDIADQMFDEALAVETEFRIFENGVRELCRDKRRPKPCNIVPTEYRDADDWLPLMCSSCGQEFDYP